ncbi:MAG: hypothetical protein HY290_23755 [Planctomycetia bacterium]|nr:hypothetical protein [Planctomycetia bacterium]
MKKMWMMMLGAVALASMGAGGCDENERLADYAKNSVDQQSRQNDQIARQNQEVTQQNRQVAEAARNLVEADARARQELVTAQQTLQSGLQAERATLDEQRISLEAERKDIAHDRYWQPVIAETLHSTGILAACLAPLLLCLFVLRSLSTAQADETVLNELLVAELVSETPRLLLPDSDARRTLVDESPVAGLDVQVESDRGCGPAGG